MHINPVCPGIVGSEALASAATAPTQSEKSAFGGVIQRFIADTNAQQLQADQSVQRLASGQSDSVHETMLAMAKADLSFRLFVEVQGKVIEAYQEVMRMQM